MKRTAGLLVTVSILTLLATLLIPPHITEAVAGTVWTDDFESYTVGTFPSPPWTNSGNTEALVDNTNSVSGNKSLKLFGIVGSCWGALAHRPITVGPPLVIRFSVYNGSEALSGCHSAYGVVALNTGPSWTTSTRTLIYFDVDDRTGEKLIRGSGCLGDPVGCVSLGPYVQETWYEVEISYEVVDPETVRIGYWINGVFKGSYDFASYPYEADLSYISLQAAEGSAWFDDVEISTPDTVTILNAVFVNPLSLLLVSATSSAAPEADLFVTVPEAGSCVDSAPMRFVKFLGSYVFTKRVPACGNLDGQMATVNSSLGGSNSAPIK